MKRLLLLSLFALFACRAAASSYPVLCVGKESVSGDSGNWVSDTYTFSVASGSAFAVRGATSWSLFLDNAVVEETYGSVDSFHCIRFVGTGSESLHIYLTGQNVLRPGGIFAKKCGMLSIHGPGSLSEIVEKKSAQAISSDGDLWIGEGAVISIVELTESGTRSSYNSIGAGGGISIVDSSVSVIHSGGTLGYGSIGCGGTGLSIVGSVVAVCADVPYNKGAIRVPSGELFVSHSSVTVFANAPAFVADAVTIDTAAIGLASQSSGISASDLVVGNTIGLIVADGSAIEAATAEFRSGNDLSIIGNAQKDDEWNAAIRLVERNGQFFHLGGATRLFAPNGTAFLGDGDNRSSHVGCADLDMRGGTLRVSADPDWSDVRLFFTASSVAATAETVLQGTVSGDTSLSLLQNFFMHALVVSWLSASTLAGSSALPVRGLSARHLAFRGGTTDVLCRTDANGICSSGSATVSGGTVYVNGSPWVPAATVSFDANGGSVTPKSRKVTTGAQIGALPKPTRKGFVFAGWFTAKSGGAAVTAATKFSKNATVYAHWAKKAYTVKFDANGGTGTMAAQKMKYGKAAKLKANRFKRDGCVFLGWAKTKKGALAYKNRQAVKNLTTKGGSVTLYAKWGQKVAVKLDANGGKVKKKSKTATTGKKLGKLPTPTRKNWNFEGWWTKKTGGTRVTASTVVKKATTVYARWTPIVTVVLDPNGGTVSKSKTKCRTYWCYGENGIIEYGLNYWELPEPKRSGYEFTMWFTKKSGGTALVWPTGPCTITLYARWEPRFHSVAFNYLDDNGDWQSLWDAFRDGRALGTLPTPSREGFEFAGWFAGEDGTGRRIDADTIANDSLPDEVYACWVRVFTVAFVSNGEVVATRSMKAGDAFDDLPVPTNGGRWDTFLYWSSDVGDKIEKGSIYDGSYRTLEACWHYGTTPVTSTTGQ